MYGTSTLHKKKKYGTSTVVFYAGDFCFSLGRYLNTLIMCLFLNLTLSIT